MTSIEKIYEFNKKAGLLDLGYSDSRECAYPIEEALEGFSNLEALGKILGFDYIDKSASPKELSRFLISLVDLDSQISDVERFDKHLDSIVFNIGSLLKLGLTLEQIDRGMYHVMNANLSKLSVGMDDQGKQQKPADFIGPEGELQKILDER